MLSPPRLVSKSSATPPAPASPRARSSTLAFVRAFQPLAQERCSRCFSRGARAVRRQHRPHPGHTLIVPQVHWPGHQAVRASAGARERPPLTLSRCSPSPAGAPPLAFRDAELLRKQVLDWKLVEEGPVLQLRCVTTAHALRLFGHPHTVCAGGPGWLRMPLPQQS